MNRELMSRFIFDLSSNPLVLIRILLESLRCQINEQMSWQAHFSPIKRTMSFFRADGLCSLSDMSPAATAATISTGIFSDPLCSNLSLPLIAFVIVRIFLAWISAKNRKLGYRGP